MADDTDAAPEEGEGKTKGGKKLLLIGAAAMVLCGAGAFAAVSMLGGGAPEEAGPDAHAEADAHVEPPAEGHGAETPGAASVAFVPVEPLTVSLPPSAGPSHLRLTAQLEVPQGRSAEVEALMPRIVDALGGYLRALEPAMLSDRDAHLRIRGQMLRRVRLVVGPEAVRDLLVVEFVLN
jgi:flagellar FliL protein